jgi:hypothetical protein
MSDSHLEYFCLSLLSSPTVVQRPFINDFSTFPESLWTNWHRKNTKPLATKVEPGKPIAQDYSFGAQWLTSVKHNLTYVVGPDSPVHHVTTDEAVNLYSAGPPYWFTAKDGFLIAQHWAGKLNDFVEFCCGQHLPFSSGNWDPRMFTHYFPLLFLQNSCHVFLK